MVYFKYAIIGIFLLSSLLLMKTTIIDTNTATDVSIKYISPSILAINYCHSTLQYNWCPLFLTFRGSEKITFN